MRKLEKKVGELLLDRTVAVRIKAIEITSKLISLTSNCNESNSDNSPASKEEGEGVEDLYLEGKRMKKVFLSHLLRIIKTDPSRFATLLPHQLLSL